MKTIVSSSVAGTALAVIFFAMALPLPASAAEDSVKPRTTLISPQQVFAPPGFDDNDNVQVVVSGALPSTCYRVGSAAAQVDRATRTITLRNEALFYPGCWCLYVEIPYVQVVNLGVLDAGNYQVLVETPSGTPEARATLPIAVATTSAPDSQLYAPVHDAVIRDAAGGKTLTLRGTMPSDCMQIDEVQTLYRAPNIIEVLPVTRVTDPSGDSCHAVSTPYEAVVKLENRWKGQTLVHIRSLNGQSVNEVVDF